MTSPISADKRSRALCVRYWSTMYWSKHAVDDAELLFCADDDDELVRMVDELDSDQQQQQTTTPGQPHFSSFSYLSYCIKFCIQVVHLVCSYS